MPKGQMKRGLNIVFLLAHNKVAATCKILRQGQSNEKYAWNAIIVPAVSTLNKKTLK